MRRKRSLPLLFAAIPLGAVLALSAAARADTVGTAGAVNTTSSGTTPGGATRVIEIGTQVVENEKIQTTATGSVQVLFIDKTTLNVGPNSTLVIDRFVYNPATTKGELALSLGKGVIRVVGGIATHSEGATIRTPVAAIGLRGGIAIISHNGASGTHAILGFGRMSVTSLCSGANCRPTTVDVSRPGYGVSVAGLNIPPSSPGRASSQELAQANGKLTSRGGQTGGASRQPTDNQARTNNVGTPTSPGARIFQTASQGRANALTAANAMGQTVQQGAQNSASVTTTKQTLIQQALLKPVTPPVTPPITPIVPIVPIIPVQPAPTATYAMVTSGPFSTTAGVSPVPYLTGAFAGMGQFTVTSVSPILGYQRGGLNTDGSPDTTSRQFQAGLGVAGKGANQNATLFVMTSAISNAPNIGFTQAGGFMGVTMRNPAGWYGLASGAVSSATAPSARNTVPTQNGVPIASFALHNSTTNLNTGTVVNTHSYNYLQTGPANYTFNPVTTGAPMARANNHPTLSLNGGYVGGVMVTATGGASPPFTNYTRPYVITNLTGQPGDVGIFLPGDSSEMLAIFNVGSVAAPNGAMASSNYIFGSLNGNGMNGLNSARGAYVNPTNFAARDAAVFNDGANTPVSSRNGQPLASIGGYSNQQMVTAESVGANTFAFLTSISTSGSPVHPCACESTQWGFWSAFNGASNNGQLTFEDQGALLLWVAGNPATAGTLPITGTATYTGHAIASIANGATPGATSYLAAGAFQAVANFGTHSGMVNITGLDGANYAGTAMQTAAAPGMPSPVTFGGTLNSVIGPGSVGGRTATLAGSFFQGGPTNSTPAYGEIGGSLILNGTGGYLGSGIFAARKP
ncbi:MAG TPA: FecR domain-containing protein [Roseiarcus sp.]